jgi:uncharacterized protein (TIGR00730 family)
MKSIAVYCGSNPGSDPAYAQAATALGTLLASQNIALVYGGGGRGLMGTVATAAMAAGGHVIGVIPKFLMEKEKADLAVPDLRIVTSMHERKALIAELSDGFIALPGGFGTFEELCETLAWATLGLHVKPFGLLNIAGFYDHFLAFIDHATHRQFISARNRAFLLASTDPTDLLSQMRAWHAQSTPKYLTPERT